MATNAKGPRKARETTVHTTREAERREVDPVHVDEDAPWLRGASLDMPPARSGMEQRWIRVSVYGREDQSNWARKQREGWSPRKADTVGNFPVPKIDQGKHVGLIGIEGMILCERPKAMGERRRKHFAKETQRRTEAIQADLEKTNNQNRNPAFGPIQMAHKSEVRYEVARDVIAQDD